jgi:hypothetical protein
MKRFLTALRRFAAKLVRPALVLFVALLIVWGLFYLGFALLLHAAHESLQSHPDPAPDYAESVTRFQRLQKMEGPEFKPVCRSILFDARIAHREGVGSLPWLHKLPSTVPRTWKNILRHRV